MCRTVVTMCTAQWSLYVPHGGHYMYRTVVTICTAQWSLYVPHGGHYMYLTAVTICTANRPLYVPHSGHYMYRTAFTICTAQRSLYIPHSGHYMYRTAVTICTAQWSLYVPHSGPYMYRTVVTIYSTSLTFNSSTFCPHSVFMCFVWIWEQTAIISLYNINWLVCITEIQCVYCAVRTGSFCTVHVNFSLWKFESVFPDGVTLYFLSLSKNDGTIRKLRKICSLVLQAEHRILSDSAPVRVLTHFGRPYEYRIAVECFTHFRYVSKETLVRQAANWGNRTTYCQR